jgi:P27 family predicted phage terminase small subunit
MRGRKPTPTKLKLVRSVRKSRINKKEPQPPISLLEPPYYLNDIEKKIWVYHAKEAHGLGIVTTLDVCTFEVMVVNWALAIRCKEELEKPLVYQGPNGGAIQNPFLPIRRRAYEQAMKAAAELGFTPSARSRVTASKPKEEEDPFAAYEAGK